MTFHEKVRAIQMVNETTEEEQIYFSDDPEWFDKPVSNFCNVGFTASSDEMLEDFELPDWFPMNTYLKNIG